MYAVSRHGSNFTCTSGNIVGWCRMFSLRFLELFLELFGDVSLQPSCTLHSENWFCGSTFVFSNVVPFEDWSFYAVGDFAALTAQGCGVHWAVFCFFRRWSSCSSAAEDLLADLPWSKDRPIPIKQRQNLAAKEQSRGRRAYCNLQIFSAGCVEVLFGTSGSNLDKGGVGSLGSQSMWGSPTPSWGWCFC